MEQYIPNYEDKTITQVANAVNDNLEFRVIKRPADGVKSYLPHQIIFAREMAIQKRMICCHPMGSGKTCSIYYAARVALQKNLINHILFVGPKTVLPQAKEQFTVKCPSASKDISRFTFMTFDTFLNMVINAQEPEGKKFPGYMIIIDEAHNRLPNKYRAHYGIRNVVHGESHTERVSDSAEDWPKIIDAIQSSEMTILSTGTFVVNDAVETIALADAISPVRLNYHDFTVEEGGRRIMNPQGARNFANATKNFFSYIDPKTQMPHKQTVGQDVTVVNPDGSSFTMRVDKVKMRESRLPGKYRSVDPSCHFAINEKTLEITSNNNCRLFEDLERVSPKHYRVLQLAERPGVSVIYMEDVHGEGVMLYAALLKRLGYEFYEGKEDIVDKKKRFTMITGSTKSIHTEKILSTHNSDENWDGSMIKIVLITNAARDGISIFYACQFIMAMSPWHIAGYDQAVARAVRADSHVLWKMRKKLDLIGQGLTDREAQKVIDQFRVEIFNVVHFPDHLDDRMTIEDSRDIPDLRRLTFCFQKQHYNRAVVSLVHSNSIECKLLKHLDISYANYDCCSNPVWKENADMENYNSMFLEEDADLRIQELKTAGYMQPTRVHLVDMLTMEKILETSMSKRTPAGIQCFEDSDGQSSFSSYFYSMGFPDPDNKVIWNDDFYCRNSTFVHTECRDAIISGKSISGENYVERIYYNIDNSGFISTETERFIAQDPRRNFDLVKQMFPSHVFRTRGGIIYHMFVPPNRERFSSYFKYPYVAIYVPSTNEWVHYEYSHDRAGVGMGKRTTAYKKTYENDQPTWRIVSGTTRVTDLDEEIQFNALANVRRMAEIQATRTTFAFVVDNRKARIVTADRGQNSSGRLLDNISGKNYREILQSLGLAVGTGKRQLIDYLNRQGRVLFMEYDMDVIERLARV